MKDPTSELHEAYFTLLNGSVSVNGTEIPVFKYEKAGNDTRIEISRTTIEDKSTKTSYMLDVLQDITIISSLKMQDQRSVADDISNSLVQLVTATVPIVMASFYTIGEATLESVDVFEDESYDNTTYRKELTFKHIVIEN